MRPRKMMRKRLSQKPPHLKRKKINQRRKNKWKKLKKLRKLRKPNKMLKMKKQNQLPRLRLNLNNL
jgi:hypothetical protein